MAGKRGEIGKISMKSDHEADWKIEDFGLSYTSEEESLLSPGFCISGEEWRLKLYPNEVAFGWISLTLYRSKFEEECAYYSVGLKKVDGTVENILKSTWKTNRHVNNYNKFLKISQLQQSNMLASGTLTLNCTLRTCKYFDSYGSLDCLSRNFTDLFTSKRDCDATVKVMGEEFPVHKIVLSARSPVFAATFESDMKEKATGIIEIEDSHPTVFREFLMYLYSGKIEDDSQNLLELYKLADKYLVEDLKTRCLKLIATSLTVENVFDAAVLGNQYDEETLMLEIQKTFNKNYKKILSTTKWDEFLIKNTAVANKLLKALAED